MDPLPGIDAGREALRRFLVGDDDLETMRTTICALAADSVAGCDATSITMLHRGEPGTPASSHDLAALLDEVQYASGDGPCLSAIRHRGVEVVEMASEQRWPGFCTEALAHGVTAVLSTPLVTDDHVLGAINMYSLTEDRFEPRSIEGAALFADQLGVAAARATYLMEQQELAGHLQKALESRAVIDQAKGILMRDNHITADEAFAMLTQASNRSNRKLREIAQTIVETTARGA
jgi:GAF domain-containing protein